MPTTTRTVFLTDENGNALIDTQGNMRALSFSLVQGFSYRLVERASIVSATYAQVVGYSTATGQTIAGVENASEFDVGDFGIVQYAISDRNNTIGYVTCKVTAVGADSLTVNGIGISVAGADGADGKDGAPGADGKDGAATVQIGTVTTGEAGSQASVTNVGADNAAILNFTIPRGNTGAQGIPGPSGAPGQDGADGAPGADGQDATITIGTVSTGAAGSEAAVTNTGTPSAAVFNFTIPRGDTGARGVQGEPGAPGADGKDGVTFTPSVGTNGDLSWSNDGGLPNPETVNVRGAQGESATIRVGQVTTLPAGSQATVTNSGDENAAVFNFGIPQGATGQTGANGQDGQDGVGIQTIAADGQDENGGNIYRITLTNGQSYTFVAPKGATGNTGATGATGAPGKDFRIYRTYASIAAMNADASNVPDGEFVMIASSENDPDNAKLYVRATGGEVAFTFISDLSGAQGIQGEAATVTIGQVLTGEPGTNASVENAGTEHEAILNFTIPRGATGAAGRDGTNGKDGKDGINGQDGADGAAATIQIGEVITGAPGTNASVENTGTENAAILKITIPRGNVGAQGVQGEPGQKGADGKDGADGAPGAAATIQIGTVTTGAAGSQAAVTNTGTANAAILNFTIPRGNTGAQGNPGNDGAPGADGASGVTDVTAGTPTEQDGYTVTPVTFNFEQGNSKTVNIQAKNGEGAGVQQNAIINRTASVTTADENSPDFVENNGGLWVKRITGYADEVDTLSATLPSGRASTSAATAPNGKIYVFGGYLGSSYLDTIVEFDPVTQSVTTLEATLPSGRDSTSAATAPNGKIYVFGGFNRNYRWNDIVEFDPIAQTATTLDVTLPDGVYSTSAATAPNGKIYVFGGYGSSYLDTIVEFDPVTQSVTTIEATLPSERDGTSAATAPNGKIYVFGGTAEGIGFLADIVEFDPIAQTATTLDVTLPDKTWEFSVATAPNGKIYVLGGYLMDTIVEFDPATQSVTTLEATLPSAKHYTSAATAPNGKIYVFGGFDDNAIVDFAPSVPQYAYSPAVVLSQAEYTQLKNILQGNFAVGISAPSFNATA